MIHFFKTINVELENDHHHHLQNKDDRSNEKLSVKIVFLITLLGCLIPLSWDSNQDFLHSVIHVPFTSSLPETLRQSYPRFFKVTPTAPMGGGTQLFEGAHLTGGIRAFIVNQANVAITSFFCCKIPKCAPEIFRI